MFSFYLHLDENRITNHKVICSLTDINYEESFLQNFQVILKNLVHHEGDSILQAYTVCHQKLWCHAPLVSSSSEVVTSRSSRILVIISCDVTFPLYPRHQKLWRHAPLVSTSSHFSRIVESFHIYDKGSLHLFLSLKCFTNKIAYQNSRIHRIFFKSPRIRRRSETNSSSEVIKKTFLYHSCNITLQLKSSYNKQKKPKYLNYFKNS